jgi:hypothetical protein
VATRAAVLIGGGRQRVASCGQPSNHGTEASSCTYPIESNAFSILIGRFCAIEMVTAVGKQQQLPRKGDGKYSVAGD